MSESGRKALLIVNPFSRRARDAKPYVEALQDGGMTLVRREVTRGKMDDLILSMRHEVDCVILGGGDGTLGGGAIAIRETGLPFGILPLGEENELARRVGIPSEPEGAAAVILAGHTAPLRLCSVNGRPFFNVATVGLSVATARRLNRAAHGRAGRLAFGWKAFGIMMQSPRFSAIIRCGSVVHRVRTLQIALGNGRYYVGSMLPGASIPADENVVAVYSLEPVNKWALLTLRHAFDAEEPDEVPEARVTRSPVVEVVTRLPRPITADGEVLTVTPARFSILPGFITVFAPDPEAAPAEVADAETEASEGERA